MTVRGCYTDQENDATPTRRILSAISFGVFWRSAPSHP